MDDLSGILIGKFHADVVTVDLPLIKEMKVIKRGNKVLEKRERTFGEVCLAGDFHYGTKVFSQPVIHGYLNFLKAHSNIQVGLMGDIINCALLSDYIPEEKTLNIDDQISEFCADWRDLADRVRFSLWGNHEEREAKKSLSNKLLRYIMNELGSKDVTLGEPQRGLFIVFKAGDQMYGCYAQHSKCNAKVNQDLQLLRSGSQNVVSIIAHGHTHRLTWKPRTFFELSQSGSIIYNLVKRQYLLATGCFLEYPSYAEASSMPLTECGAPIIKFYADSHELGYYDLTMSYHDYIKYDSAGAGVEDVYEHANRELSQSLSPKEETVSSRNLSESNKVGWRETVKKQNFSS